MSFCKKKSSFLCFKYNFLLIAVNYYKPNLRNTLFSNICVCSCWFAANSSKHNAMSFFKTLRPRYTVFTFSSNHLSKLLRLKLKHCTYWGVIALFFLNYLNNNSSTGGCEDNHFVLVNINFSILINFLRLFSTWNGLFYYSFWHKRLLVNFRFPYHLLS